MANTNVSEILNKMYHKLVGKKVVVHNYGEFEVVGYNPNPTLIYKRPDGTTFPVSVNSLMADILEVKND